MLLHKTASVIDGSVSSSIQNIPPWPSRQGQITPTGYHPCDVHATFAFTLSLGWGSTGATYHFIVDEWEFNATVNSSDLVIPFLIGDTIPLTTLLSETDVTIADLLDEAIAAIDFDETPVGEFLQDGVLAPHFTNIETKLRTCWRSEKNAEIPEKCVVVPIDTARGIQVV